MSIRFSLLLLVLIACSCDRWGSNEKSALGKQEGNRIVVALEAYKKNTGEYPDTLEQLVPAYSDKKFIESLSSGPVEFSYERKNSQFELFFGYKASGSNICYFVTRERSLGWRCVHVS